jgi:hypothetical protein
MASLTFAGLVLAAPTHRPHMGGSEGSGSIYWNPNPDRHGWTVAKWGGCQTTVRYYFEASIPASWKAPIRNAVNTWDNPTYCSPRFIETTTAGSARLKFRVEDDVYCGMDGSAAWYAIACRNYAASTVDQVWTVAFNTEDAAFGVASSGRFDIESITLNEMGHVLYLDHNSNWLDGVVQANSCKWGTASCTVVDDLGFPDWSSYGVSCTNCGSRRTVRTGDLLFINYLYGKPPCTGVCPNSGTASGASMMRLDPGPLSAAALAAEVESQNPDSPYDFMHDVHYLDE